MKTQTTEGINNIMAAMNKVRIKQQDRYEMLKHLVPHDSCNPFETPLTNHSLSGVAKRIERREVFLESLSVKVDKTESHGIKTLQTLQRSPSYYKWEREIEAI